MDLGPTEVPAAGDHQLGLGPTEVSPPLRAELPSLPALERGVLGHFRKGPARTGFWGQTFSGLTFTPRPQIKTDLHGAGLPVLVKDQSGQSVLASLAKTNPPPHSREGLPADLSGTGRDLPETRPPWAVSDSKRVRLFLGAVLKGYHLALDSHWPGCIWCRTVCRIVV